MGFSRKGSKVVLLSVLSYLFKYNWGMVMSGLNTHILEARGSKLQIADLFYLWQLIYLTINKAMYSS